jgi:acetamidase/formamidase
VSDPEVLKFRPDPSQYAWTFGGAAPVARVRPPVILEVFTEDCFAGKVRSETDLVSQVCEFPYLNPQTGPFYVEGAEPGDTLAVHFISIEPARDWGASTTVPFFGALTATHATVGVAPANLEVRSALVPDAFGGNMDTPEMRAGVTCYLGVNVEGALFSLGDGHARQGEGETCGVAVETAMNTVLAIDLVKGRPCPWPRLESASHIMTAGSARPLEDAFRIAQLDLVQWLGSDYGLDPLDAYQLVTQAVEAPLANVCDPNYTSVAKIAKDYLPPAGPMNGAHAALTALAGSYRG